jgi:hypothetical protein
VIWRAADDTIPNGRVAGGGILFETVLDSVPISFVNKKVAKCSRRNGWLDSILVSSKEWV